MRRPVSQEIGGTPVPYRRLEEVYTPITVFENRTYRLRICPGFVWRPSVPRPAWLVAPPHQMYPASLIHDWMYRYKGDLTGYCGGMEVRKPTPEGPTWEEVEQVDRTFADRFFKHCIQEGGGEWLTASTAYLGVRLGGGRKWRSPYQSVDVSDLIASVEPVTQENMGLRIDRTEDLDHKQGELE